jgi:hypothetical protein
MSDKTKIKSRRKQKKITHRTERTRLKRDLQNKLKDGTVE